MDFYKKYLKYKSKYILLKSLIDKQTGGGKPLINNPHIINLFTDPDMERFLNPIYGYIMCEIGYISNNYYLHMHKFINTTESKIINKMCNIIPDGIQPTNDIMKLEPIDFGRYIALKYINMKNNIITTNINKPGKYIFTSKLNNNEIDKNNLTNYIQKLHKFIPLIDNNDEIFFHFILYCFWWNAESEDGIKKYYDGINEVFSIMNKYLPVKYTLVDFTTVLPSNFEKIIVELLKKPFKIYNQEWSNNFCPVVDAYSDCGETTARNLINLICFDDNKFDIDILKKYKPVPQLIKYYETFNDFNKQSDKKEMIYGQELNARDAWSYLIIKHAFHNLNFIRTCNSDNTIRFELDAGLSTDRKTGNFMQLIKNLLGIDKWDDIVNKYITSIDDNTQDGIGNIYINHAELGDIYIYCERRHYYMNISKKNKYSDNIDKIGFNKEKQIYIDYILKNNMNINNYIFYDIDSNILSEWIERAEENGEQEILVKLFELSLTNKYDSDLRRRIRIDTDGILFEKIKTLNENKKINEYEYYSKDLTFIKCLPNLTHLNLNLKNNQSIEMIDLSILSNIKSIGNNFLKNCSNLQSIDLSILSNITSIGDYFLHNCSNLQSIDLSILSNVTSIGRSFLSRCSNLQSINLSGLSNVKYIDYDFMSNCSNLQSIDLSILSNITHINGDFMSNCSNLQSIDLSILSNVKSIGDYFLYDCSNLQSINLSGLSNLTSIGDIFMSNCTKLESIDLSGLSNLTSIGNYFMSKCFKLQSINLSGLSNVTSISDNFMDNCPELTSIDLSGLSNLTSIGDYFLDDCSNLQSINLSGLSNVTSIGDNFMSNCDNLQSIDLSILSNLTSIGNYFMFKCIELQSIDLSGLSNVASIGDYFLSSCFNLLNIDLSTSSNIKSIGNNFLEYCSNLQSIDLRILSNVTSIGDIFMSNCNNLQSIDLSILSNVKSIGNYFLLSCFNLQSIDLSILSNVTSIGDYFLYDCSNLQSIDLDGLSNVTSIGNSFMSSCSNLQSIDLSGLSNLTYIGDNFMSDCSMLKNINLSSLTNLISIGVFFMKNCQMLNEIDFSKLLNIMNIGNNFLFNCTKLTVIVLNVKSTILKKHVELYLQKNKQVKILYIN